LVSSIYFRNFAASFKNRLTIHSYQYDEDEDHQTLFRSNGWTARKPAGNGAAGIVAEHRGLPERRAAK
jgi:hypothetical protein